jgi:hypothetical protein
LWITNSRGDPKVGTIAKGILTNPSLHNVFNGIFFKNSHCVTPARNDGKIGVFDLKHFMAVVLCLVIVLFCPVYSAIFFDDIKGHWAEGDILKWTAQGFFEDDEYGYFNPEDDINRAEFAVILSRIMNYPDIVVYNTYFIDLPQDTWFTNAILQARKAKIYMGDQEGTIRPGDSISRQEMAIFICRVLGINTIESMLEFSDNSDIAPFAYSYISALKALKIVEGNPDNTFKPQESITRAETVHILSNAITYIIDSTKVNINAKYAIINTKNIALKNANISNNLIISEGLERGSLLLDNVKVLGDFIIRGSGTQIQTMAEGVITLTGGSTAKRIIIDNENYTIIEIYPGTVIDNIEIRTPCKIINHGIIKNIIVICDGVSIETESDINITGNFKANIKYISEMMSTNQPDFIKDDEMYIAPTNKIIMETPDPVPLNPTYPTSPPTQKPNHEPSLVPKTTVFNPTLPPV